MPPRHGKSRTLVNFSAWLLGLDETVKIITASYNDELAQDFSRYTRNVISEKQEGGGQPVYGDVFDARIKRGDSAFHRWSLEGQFFNYKGTGIGGTVTGKGGNLLIIDDPIKGAEEAYNENYLDRVWRWYTGTWLSRKESGAREIVCMTPWAKKDLTGRILEEEPDDWYVLSFEAYTEKQGMLCSDLLSYEEYEKNKRLMDEPIFWANYHNRRIDIQGKLYSELKEYTELPRDDDGNVIAQSIVSYTDTADEGDDYLCHIVAVVSNGVAYVTDVIYTKEAQERTEEWVVNSIMSNGTRVAHIESNNGGRAFARNVDRILRGHGGHCKIHWFHQSQNKKTRILTNAPTVQNDVLFPVGWRQRWPGFYEAMITYQREGKNKHDDAPDAVTGLVEKALRGNTGQVSKISAGRLGL
jgi:predicted phage terminase large subunit-like protein